MNEDEEEIEDKPSKYRGWKRSSDVKLKDRRLKAADELDKVLNIVTRKRLWLENGDYAWYKHIGK